MRNLRGSTRRVLGILLLASCLLLTHAQAFAWLNGAFHEGQFCVVLEDGHDIADFNERWDTVTLASLPERNTHLQYRADVDDMELFLSQVLTDRAVLMADPNFHLESPEGVRQMVIGAVGGSVTDFEDQQMGERIGIALAHDITRGEGITVAVLDTGVDPDHELFAGRLSPLGLDLVDMDQEPWETANGIDDDGDGLTDEGFGHGTMVAGLVLLVAPEAQILPIRILDDEGRTDLFKVVSAIGHADNAGAHVLNMSFGVATEIPSIISYTLENSIHPDLIAIAGAGNENREEVPFYPACFPEVMMVTALDSCDIKADFADFSSQVLVSAPGTGIRSAWPGNDWGLGSGCSFACPLVAGEAALVLSLDPLVDSGEMQVRIAAATEEIYHLPDNQNYLGMLGAGRIYLPIALGSTAIDEQDFDLGGFRVWPNPIGSQVRFRIPAGFAGGRIAIFDIRGRQLREFALADRPNPMWDGRDRDGTLVPSGVYLVRLSCGGQQRSTRLVWLR